MFPRCLELVWSDVMQKTVAIFNRLLSGECFTNFNVILITKIKVE